MAGEHAVEEKKKGSSWLWMVKLLGIGLFVFILLQTDVDAMLKRLSGANPLLLSITALLSVITLNVIKSFRWHLILRWIGIPTSYLNTFVTYQASVFVGLMTPGRLGEMFRSVYLRTDFRTPITTGIASTGTDRMFDLFGLLSLAGVSLLATPAYGESRNAGWWFLGACAIIFIVLLLLRSLTPERLRSLSILGLRFPGRLLGDFIHQLRLLTPLRVLLQLVNTYTPVVIFSVQCSLLAHAIDIPLNPLVAGGIAAVGTLASIIPVSFYGFGTREAAVLALMGMLRGSNSSEEAVAFALIFFFNFWVVGALWGSLFWLLKPMKVGEAKKIQADGRVEALNEE